MLKLIRPRYFLSGIALGFIICCLVGYIVSGKARFHHFTRFFSHIDIEEYYYPTASELLATARHEAKKDKILVLIGGSSVFRGVGQNPGEVWSEELQKQLGDKYKVLNFANNSAGLASFGGVAYRMLFDEYPNMIFVSTCDYAAEKMDGNEVYDYVFWDAYYKHYIRTDRDEQAILEKLRKTEMQTSKGMEMHLLTYLDSYLYFRSLWNWVGYRYVFTVWNSMVTTTPFRARHRYKDTKINFQKLITKIQRKDPDKFAREVKAIAGIFPSMIDVDKQTFKADRVKVSRSSYEDIYAPRYRQRMLCVVTSYSPKHMAQLSKQDQAAYAIFMKMTPKLIESVGYHAISAANLTGDDYGDPLHFLASGGKKVAMSVSAKVKEIAAENKYISGYR